MISTGLTAFLFRRGYLLGGGEIGVQFYNPERMFGISGWSWGGMILGGSSGLTVAAAPFFALFVFLQKFAVSGFLSQALFFFIVFSISLVSMYLLTREIFPSKPSLVYLLSALFYLVNPYALVNVWNRFLQNPMLFYAFLPLGIWLFVRGLKKKSYAYAVLNMLLTAVFSLGFAGPSQALSFWSLLLLVSIFYFIFFEKKRFVVFYFLFSFFIWVTFNFFWISQQFYFRFSPSYSTVSTLFFTETGNLQTFISQSRVLGQLSNLFVLQHYSFFNQSVDLPFEWPLFYVNPFAKALEWLVTINILLVAIRKRKNPWVSFLVVVFLAGVFTSKGNSPPLGEIFDFLFKKISFLEFFRNPFEKLGFLLPLSFSPLFGIAYEDWRAAAKKKLHLALNLGVFFYLFIFLGFPFLTGLVFTSGNPPANDPKIGYEVEVPEYYREADNFLSSQPGIFRFITFPIGGEGIFNTWTRGYAGVEQSGVLFSTPSVSYNTGIPYLNMIVPTLEELFLENKDFYKVAKILNAKYLMFRPDFDFRLSNMRDPQIIDNVLNQRVKQIESKLSFVSEFGKLKLYKFADETFLSKIYAPNRIITNNLDGKIGDILFGDDSQDYAIFTYSKRELLPPFLEGDHLTAAHNHQFFVIDSPFPAYSDDVFIFPYVSHLPRSRFYPLVLLKEKLQGVQRTSLQDKANWELSLLGKRLVEVNKSIEENDFEGAKIALKLYRSALPRFFSKFSTLNLTQKAPDQRVWNEELIFKAFSSHIYLLNEFERTSLNQENFVTEVSDVLRLCAGEHNITPFHRLISTAEFPLQSRLVYQIEIIEDGNYEVLLPRSRLFPDSFDFQDPVFIQVDNEVVSRQASQKDSYISLGKFLFSKGFHEIGINQVPLKNLVTKRDFEIEVETEVREVKLPIEDLDPYEEYSISFDYWLRNGGPLSLRIEQNVDEPATKRKPIQARDFGSDVYWFDYKTISFLFRPKPFADTASLTFSAKPWNDCEVIFKNQKKCDDEQFRKLYDRPTYAFVKNLEVLPQAPRNIILLKEGNGFMVPPLNISFFKINNTKYRVNVRGAQDSFPLVFSELYDAGWKAYVVDKETKINEIPFGQVWRLNQVSEENHILVNGYANAWWIEKEGDYDIVLEYAPQRLLYIGYAVTAFSVFSGIVYFGYSLVSKRRVSSG